MIAAIGRNKWSLLFGLWILHGVIALWQFTSLYLNKSHLPVYVFLLDGLLLFWIAVNLSLVVLIFRRPDLVYGFFDKVNGRTAKDFLIIASVFLVSLYICLLTLRGLYITSGNIQYVADLAPFFPFLSLAAFVLGEIALLIFFFTARDFSKRELLRDLLIKIWVVQLALALVTFFIQLTSFGISQAGKGDWARGLPAVPLLEWQIVLACLVCITTVIVEVKLKKTNNSHMDGWFCILIWLLAMGLWFSYPIIPSASALKPHEPNFEIYPFIDAQVYDEYAQSTLIGNDFGTDQIPQRPLYIVMLVWMHVLVGQSYSHIIFMQSLFLALFPVFLYLLGKEFFGRPIGISIALLATLRDYTSNFVAPFTGNLSYSKLYLSEIPTAILLVLFLLIGVRWIKAGFTKQQSLLLGCILGVGMLIRTQVVVALPVTLFFGWLAARSKWKTLVKSSSFVLVAMVIVIAPWLWRNFYLTGQFMFDNPGSQIANLALRYTRLNGTQANIAPLSGETSPEYNDRLKDIALQAFHSNPKGILVGITSAFLNHSVNNILLFPLRSDLKSFNELLTPTDAFWEKWDGKPTIPQSILLTFYVALFGLGVATAWQRNGWLGLLPLALNLAYNLWTSLALLSGQRFMLTMDWSIYLYYMIGIFAILSAILYTLESSRGMILKWYELNHFSPTLEFAPSPKWQYVVFGVFFLGIGLSLPLTEIMFPKRYPLVSQSEVLGSLSLSHAFDQSAVKSSCLQTLVDQNKLHIFRGRDLYPRYYFPRDGEHFTDAAGYKPVNQGRLVFEMVGQANSRIIFPMSQSPDFFPNAADVTVFMNDASQPTFIFIRHGDTEKFYISDLFDVSSCQ